MSRLAAILAGCLLLGCASMQTAQENVKTYLDYVDENYDCIGVEIKNKAAICIDDVAFTVTVTF